MYIHTLGAREARRLIEQFGVRGFKFHPTDFEQIEIRPEVRPLILKQNAAKVLCLET